MKILGLDLSVFLSIVAIVLSLVIAVPMWILNSKINQTNGILNEIKLQSGKDSIAYLKRDSLTDEIIKLKFEKSSYTEILDAQSNLTIGYITLLFALFGIVGLKLSSRLSEDIKEDYQEEKRKIQKEFRAYKFSQGKNYIVHKDEILKLINDSNKEFIDLKIDTYIDHSNFHLFVKTYTKDLNRATYIVSCIFFGLAQKNLYDLEYITKEELIDSLKGTITDALNSIAELNNEVNLLSDFRSDFENLDQCNTVLIEFLKIDDVELRQTASSLFAVLNEGATA